MMHSSPALTQLLHHELTQWEQRLVLLRVALVILVLLLAGWAALAIGEQGQPVPVYVVPGAKVAGSATPARP